MVLFSDIFISSFGSLLPPQTMNYILKCPKCYKTRAAEDKYKSWKCFKCGYVMNRKNTKIQARTINIEENQYVINELDKKKKY